nr:hypothetical protein [Tanacetum cinerariifolium]
MADVVGHDIFENILLRLDVEDLMRCKSVCKSWQSLISHPSFVSTHLNHSYNNDRNNSKIYHRRIVIPTTLCRLMYYKFGEAPFCYLVGSSNGLICTCSSDAEIIVTNPCTREMRKVPHDFGSLCWSMCSGFIYDSSLDDYKLVVGLPKGEDGTLFQVFSLKSNAWKVIREVKYRFIVQLSDDEDPTGYRVGILCNGALHWIMYDAQNQKNKTNPKTSIISFDFSKEYFKEIPQPDGDKLYQSLCMDILIEDWRGLKTKMCLGTWEECLCVFYYNLMTSEVHRWIMKNYNAKDSWEKMGQSHDHESKKFEVMHFLTMENSHSLESALRSQSETFQLAVTSLISSPIFVRSLVSPYVHPPGKEESGN